MKQADLPPPPPPVATPRSVVATIRALPRAARRHLDRLVTLDMAIGILAGTVTTLLLAFVAEAGQLAVWLAAFTVPLIVQEVRSVTRRWSRSKALRSAALLALVEGKRSGKLSWAPRKAMRGLRDWAAEHVAPAVVASGVTIGGFTIVSATTGLPNPFFDEVRMEVLGFSTNDSPQEDALVEPGGTIRACNASIFYASIRAEDLERGTRWVQRWEVKDEVFMEVLRWRGEEDSTETWGPYYQHGATGEPTGEPLTNGVWLLTIQIAGETVEEASIRLVNDAC